MDRDLLDISGKRVLLVGATGHTPAVPVDGSPSPAVGSAAGEHNDPSRPASLEVIGAAKDHER